MHIDSQRWNCNHPQATILDTEETASNYVSLSLRELKDKKDCGHLEKRGRGENIKKSTEGGGGDETERGNQAPAGRLWKIRRQQR